MSWNNVLPAWIIFHERAEREALMSCAFPAEWHSGMSIELPRHLQGIDRACMKSYEEGGWNSAQIMKVRLEAW